MEREADLCQDFKRQAAMNILGALHAILHELYSISSTELCQSNNHDGAPCVPARGTAGQIDSSVLDNARYKRCKLVAKMAKKHRIHLVFLPPYSRNLNLIERFWKYPKKKVLVGFHYPTKEAFIEAIGNFIYEVNEGLHDDEMNGLLNLKFQILQAA